MTMKTQGDLFEFAATREEIGLLIDGVAHLVDETHQEAAPLLRRLQSAYRDAKAGVPTWPGGRPKKPTFVVAGELIATIQATPEFAEVFQRVKFDTADSVPADLAEELAAEGVDVSRWVVVVAKGEHADRLAEAYDDA